MALDVNNIIEVAHKAAKPFIMKGLQVGIIAVDKQVEATGTIADNLLWADVKESFQVSE